MYCVQFNSPGSPAIGVAIPPMCTGEPKSSQITDGRSPNGELAHGDTRGESSPGKRMSILPNVSHLHSYMYVCICICMYCMDMLIHTRREANARVCATQRNIIFGGFVCGCAFYVCTYCAQLNSPGSPASGVAVPHMCSASSQITSSSQQITSPWQAVGESSPQGLAPSKSN